MSCAELAFFADSEGFEMNPAGQLRVTSTPVFPRTVEPSSGPRFDSNLQAEFTMTTRKERQEHSSTETTAADGSVGQGSGESEVLASTKKATANRRSL